VRSRTVQIVGLGHHEHGPLIHLGLRRQAHVRGVATKIDALYIFGASISARQYSVPVLALLPARLVEQSAAALDFLGVNEPTFHIMTY